MHGQIYYLLLHTHYADIYIHIHTLKGRIKNNNNKTIVYLIVPNSLPNEYFESRLKDVKLKFNN